MSFVSVRFAVFWVPRDLVGGDGAKKSIEELSNLNAALRGHDGICVMVHLAREPLKKSLQVNIVGDGGLLHQGVNEIVSDLMHCQLFENHLGGEATKEIHVEHGFDLSEVQLEVPALEIELFQFLGWMKLRIEQGGGENDFFGVKTWNGNLKS